MRLTIREIAARAGVTKSTVSKVLNDRPGVGNETRKKVQDIVRQTGFQPSSSARALARGSSGNLGLLIPRQAGLSLNSAYWGSLATSITMEAARCGYNILLLTPAVEDGEDDLVEETVRRHKTDGLIIGHPKLAVRSLSLLADRGVPFITVGRHEGWEELAVDVDNSGGGLDIARYMIDRGYRRISMLTGPRILRHMRERARGFSEGMLTAGLEPSIVYTGFEQEAVERGLKQVFSNPSPDALFVGSGGEYLLRVLRAMERLGIDRRHIGLTVFDDYPYLEFTSPGITAVRQPTEELGRQAVSLLDGLISGAILQGPTILETDIVPRQSCGEIADIPGRSDALE